jgi:O-succinylbenzoic acid--CoA ligase
MSIRPLTRLDVPPGPAGAGALLAAIPAALAGSGPALAPLDPTVAPELRARLATAVRADESDAPLENDDIAVVVATSGSTGDPAGVLLSATALTFAATSGQEQLGGPGHWLVAVPVTSVGGLMTLVRSVTAGTDPIFWPGLGGAESFTAESFLPAAEELLVRANGGRSYLSLVPTQLDRLVRSGGAVLEVLARFSAIVIGAAELSQTTRHSAVSAGVKVVRSYGLSETCGGICYEGHLFDQVTAKIEAPDGHGVGRVIIGGPTLASGYRLAPDRTVERFGPSGLRTEDLGRIDDGRLTVVGRTDDVVQIGGTAVALNAVADVLRRQPGVHDAAAVAIADAEWGGRVVAILVPAAHRIADDDLLPRLQRAVSDRLGRLAAPVAIRKVAELPLLPNGKPDRQALLALAES